MHTFISAHVSETPWTYLVTLAQQSVHIILIIVRHPTPTSEQFILGLECKYEVEKTLDRP